MEKGLRTASYIVIAKQRGRQAEENHIVILIKINMERRARENHNIIVVWPQMCCITYAEMMTRPEMWFPLSLFLSLSASSSEWSSSSTFPQAEPRSFFATFTLPIKTILLYGITVFYLCTLFWIAHRLLPPRNSAVKENTTFISGGILRVRIDYVCKTGTTALDSKQLSQEIR